MIEDFQINAEHLSFRANGLMHTFSLAEISPKLAQANEEEREDFIFSPAGYGIHWGKLDEDLSFKGLLNMK